MRQKITKKMTIFGIGIILVSLFGLSLAGVLEYYGKVIASINVSPPIFYLNKEKIVDGIYYLSINKFDQGEVKFNGMITGTNIHFISDNLQTDSWYRARWIINLTISANSSGTVRIYFYQYDNNLIPRSKICESDAVDICPSEPIQIVLECNVGTLNLIQYRRLGLQITGYGNVEYTIYLDGRSRIEIVPLS